MSDRPTTYLLPCSCGRDIRIEPRQAGETVLCECGETCAIPTMREVQRLRPAPAVGISSTATKSAWENPQRLLVTGLVLLLLAAIAAVILYGQFPAQFAGLPAPEAERQRVESMSILERMRYFHQRILPGIELREPPMFQSKRNMLNFAMTTLGGLAVIGVILAGIGIAGIVRRR